jgi:hypothetical protein
MASLNDPRFSISNSVNVNSISSWVNHLKSLDVNGVITGTSRTQAGLSSESFCREAANQMGLIVVAIEDYPGNFPINQSSQIDLLVVESDLVCQYWKRQIGFSSKKIILGANIRYQNTRTLVQKQSLSRVLNAKGNYLLWIGQPETSTCFKTLTLILPKIKSLGLRLLFKAHPQDVGYQLGEYGKLFDSYECIEDITSCVLQEIELRNVVAVLTHFSSFAIEIGFFGVPLIHVLLPNVGGRLFKNHNRYDVPFIVQAGGSIVMSDPKDLDLLHRLTYPNLQITEVLYNFSKYYQVNDFHVSQFIDQLSEASSQIM